MATAVALESPYWAMLENLSSDMKLRLIGLLFDSVRHASKAMNHKDTAHKFYGVWHDDKDADTLVEEIRSGRTFRNREMDWA